MGAFDKILGGVCGNFGPVIIPQVLERATISTLSCN